MESTELSAAHQVKARKLVTEIKEHILNLHTLLAKAVGEEPGELTEYKFVVGSHGKQDKGSIEPDDYEYGSSICNTRTHKGYIYADPPGICRPITC